jgi:putative N6-adenine-specific DNA methylase
MNQLDKSSTIKTRDCFAVCAPGLEPSVHAELSALGIACGRPGRGGVPFRATPRQLYAANAWSRTTTRVLVRLGRFRATDFDGLARRIGELGWSEVVTRDLPLVVHASSSGSRLYHTGAIAERVSAAIARSLGFETFPAAAATNDRHQGRGHADRDHLHGPDADAVEPVQLVTVRIRHDEVTVSVDSSGDALHRRGWRLATSRAPMRPTLAAGMIAAIGWDGIVPLVDPFCGSGTIAIEAALRAGGIAPGAHRSFAFQRWPGFEPGTWASVRAGLVPRAATTDAPSAALAGAIVAADRDAGAVEATRANADRAGVADAIRVEHASLGHTLREVVPSLSVPGWIVTNPPYGRRLRGGDVRDLHASLGAALRGPLAGWRVALLVDDATVARQLGVPLREVLRTTSGGVRVVVLASEG